jgi:hypothetical protein
MRSLFVTFLCLGLVLCVTAQLVAADVPGVAVGKKAPVFKLKDQKGKEQSLEELLKKRNVALVFYRSADW